MKKMNNKGFSLVELIIVIAIMAILIVVLAPQYLKYVEKSRNSTDMQTATEFMDACEVWAADPDATGTNAYVAKDTIKITSTTGVAGTISGTGNGEAATKAALESTGLKESDFKCQSRTKWTTMDIQGTVMSNGSISWWSSDSDFAGAMGLPNTAPTYK